MFSFVIYLLFLVLTPQQVSETEFLIILRDQADLTPAYLLPGKLERGQFTRDALMTTAESSQRDLRAWLESHQIEHRSFYIVNAVWIKSNQSIADEIAVRPDVLRVERNPYVRLQIPLQPNEVDTPNTVEPGLTTVRAPEVWAMGYSWRRHHHWKR